MVFKNEEDAIRAAKKGNADGHAYLYKRYRVFVINSIAKLINNPELVEDLCQDTFIKVMEKVYQFKGNSKFSTWLYRIAINMALGSLRKAKANKDVNFSDITEHKEEVILEDLSSQKLIDEQLIEDTFVREIFSIESISEDDRMLFFQHYIVGRTHSELSDMYGISMPSIKSRIFRTRNTVKDYFKKNGS